MKVEMVGLRGRVLRVAAALIGALTLGACTANPPPPTLLTARAMEYQMAASIIGAVTLSPSGCYQLEGQPLVWPAGSVLAGQTVRLPDGRTVASGDRIAGEGGILAAADVWGLLDPGSQQHASQCFGAGTVEVAVVQTIQAS